MAQFDIHLEDGQRLTYDTNPSLLLDTAGERVPLKRFAYPYVDGAPGDNGQIEFSADNPIVGKHQPRILKIQLGLGCNYACSYCSQGGQKPTLTSNKDALDFISQLDTWLHEHPAKIEFWGGEPILYWQKIECLVPALRARFPDAALSIVTNGSLLTTEKAAWLYQNGFSVAVSHDGPGQSLRGEDPFDDPAWVAMIRNVFRMFGNRITFNTVITPLNFDLAQTFFWFEDHMGFEVRVNVEDIVTDYGGAQWTDDQLEAMYLSIKAQTESGLALAFPRIRWSAMQLMESLAIGKPLAGSHQVCGMDRKDQLAVDLHGNVLTCQNAGAESGHKIGTVQDLSAVRLNTGKSFSVRPNCNSCPVVHLCYGSCLFLDGDDFTSSCKASYWYNRAILEGVITLLTGLKVRSISGWRPGASHRVIMMKVVK